MFFRREPGLSGALTLRCDLGQVTPPFPEGVHCASNLPTVPQSEMAPGAADGQVFLSLHLDPPADVSEQAHGDVDRYARKAR